MHKKILKLSLMIFFGLNANAATWVDLGKSESAEFQYDSSILQGSNDDKKLLIKVNVIGDAKDNAKSRLIQYSVNCDNGSYLMENMKLYDLPNLMGNERNVNVANMKRTEAKPNTISQLYINTACKQNLSTNKTKNGEDIIGTRIVTADSSTKSDINPNFIKFKENNEREIYYGNIKRFENFRSIDWIVNLKQQESNGTKSQYLPDMVDCKNRQMFVDEVVSYSKDWNKGEVISKIKQEGLPGNIYKYYENLYSEICANESYPLNSSIKNKWSNVVKNYNEKVKKQEEDQKNKEIAENLKKAKEFPYYAVLTCTVGTSHTVIEGCFTGDHSTEIELRNGKEYGLYKVFNFSSIGQRTNNGFFIDLRNNFELTAQNSSKNLILGVKLFNRKTNEIIYQKQVSMFGVIKIKN